MKQHSELRSFRVDQIVDNSTTDFDLFLRVDGHMVLYAGSGPEHTGVLIHLGETEVLIGASEQPPGKVGAIGEAQGTHRDLIIQILAAGKCIAVDDVVLDLGPAATGGQRPLLVDRQHSLQIVGLDALIDILDAERAAQVVDLPLGRDHPMYAGWQP